MTKRRSSSKRPRTKLKVVQLLGERKPSELADAMGLKFYTQIYQYTKDDANPTLLMLEQLADGLTKILNRKIRVTDLFGA